MQYDPLTNKMRELLSSHQKLTAIKLYMDFYHVSLREAKSAIDYYDAHPEAIDGRGGSTGQSTSDAFRSPGIHEIAKFNDNLNMKEQLFESMRNALTNLYGISPSAVSENSRLIDILPMTDLEKSGYYGDISIAKTRSSGYKKLKYEQLGKFIDYVQHAYDVPLAGEDLYNYTVNDVISYVLSLNSGSIEVLKELIRTSRHENKASLYYRLAKLYNEENPEELKEAIESCIEGLKYTGNNDTSHWILYNHLKNLSKKRKDVETGDIAWVRQACFTISRKAPKEIFLDDVRQAERDFDDFDTMFVESLFSMPYIERKAIMPVNQYTTIDVPHLRVVDIKKIPQDLSFPIGHPVANHVYIGHPYVATKYLPIEDYQQTLIEDKVREYCEIAQSLGAISIDIKALNSYESTSSRDSSLDASGEIHALRQASADYRQNIHSHLMESLVNSIALHQTYRPTKEPAIPDDCIWYQNEPSWQRLVKQRMTGGLLVHEERVETKKAQMLDGQELSSIKGAVKGIFSELNISFSKQDEHQYELQENGVLSIEVHFAPIESLGVNSTPVIETSRTNIPTSSVSSDEQEYLEEVKACLADGEIGPRERKSLERFASRLGISQERALELEATLTALSLNDEEKEYLEEVRFTLEDGEIGPRERKFLDRCASRLGISPERAKEIESTLLK